MHCDILRGMAIKKSPRRFRAVSVTLENELIPRVREEARRLDITVSQLFRRIAKQYIETVSAEDKEGLKG